jgi:hypothetical protein
MSALVKLSSKLPGDYETNGVDQIAADLVDDPRAVRIAVVWFDTQRTIVDTDTDDHIPVIRVRRIEPLGLVEDVGAAVRDAVQTAVQARTGRAPIAFTDLEATAGNSDPDQLELEDPP